MNNTVPNVVCFVGGTGGYVLSKGLYPFADGGLINLTVVFTVADTGGSARTLVYEFGLMPFSDAIQILLALSPDHEADQLRKVMKSLIGHRFDRSDLLSGQRSGNLIYAALVELLGGEIQAIEFIANEILQVVGQVEPVSYEKAELVARYENGGVIVGESSIDVPIEPWQTKFPIVNLGYERSITANPKVIEAINNADWLIFGPGDPFTSVLPTIIVDGVVNAIRESTAKIIVPINLMSKLGQTNLFPTAKYQIALYETYLRRKVDIALVNSSDPHILQEAMESYQSASVQQIVNDLDSNQIDIFSADLLLKQVVQTVSGDRISRSLIRHDPRALGNAIYRIFTS